MIENCIENCIENANGIAKLNGIADGTAKGVASDGNAKIAKNVKNAKNEKISKRAKSAEIAPAADNAVELKNLTKDYGGGRGVFGLNLSVARGEAVGYAGTNGSGKTTTIRHIMGFLTPTSGGAFVNGLSSREHSSEIVKQIGYVPGEIAFPDLKTGVDFLKCQAEFLGLKDMRRANEFIERLQLDPSVGLKRMSKGMKQKTALVAALMNDAPVLILDEPTTGLDPLMRATFLDIINEERARGKTVFISSHSFDELEKTCDRVALINDGRIADVCDLNDIKNPAQKNFKIEFITHADYLHFLGENYQIVRRQEQYNQVTVRISSNQTAKLLGVLRGYNVKFISELTYTLEMRFKSALEAEHSARKTENKTITKKNNKNKNSQKI